MLLHELQVARFVVSGLGPNYLHRELFLGIVPAIEVGNHRQRQRKICERGLLSLVPAAWLDRERSHDKSYGSLANFVWITSELARHSSLHSKSHLVRGKSIPFTAGYLR